MPKTIIAEGRTTSEAISNGLKELNVSKERVNIKVLEEHEKRSFFSILAPRVVKVELTLKEEAETKIIKEKDKIEISEEELILCKDKLNEFLNEFLNNFKDIHYNINIDKNSNFININIDGEDSKVLIGYRGEVLNAIQIILNSIISKNNNHKIKAILNISNYKEKREKSLEELADKISKTVLKNGKSITLEPMMAYERKIIHNRLQNNAKIKTYSIGEEPYRKIVISKK